MVPLDCRAVPSANSQKCRSRNAPIFLAGLERSAASYSHTGLKITSCGREASQPASPPPPLLTSQAPPQGAPSQASLYSLRGNRQGHGTYTAPSPWRAGRTRPWGTPPRRTHDGAQRAIQAVPASRGKWTPCAGCQVSTGGAGSQPEARGPRMGPQEGGAGWEVQTKAELGEDVAPAVE